jgi:DNA-binding transcriptional MocR family regulator
LIAIVPVNVDVVAEAITEPSARGIAAAVGRLISDGTLVPGARLPTVREVSRRLGLSATTVSDAWQRLARSGVIEGRGRLGTFVAPRTRSGGPRRYRSITATGGHVELDLSTGSPDPALLPDAVAAVARVPRASMATNYWDRPVLPALEELLWHRQPFEAEALTVVDGALDALDRVASWAVGLGDRVVVENPAFPPLLDLLDLLGAELVPVDVDDEGMVLDQLVTALELRPRAVFLQPRAQNPTGYSMSSARAEALAGAMAGSAVLVVEDDHSGEISTSPNVSLGTWMPERTVRITSYSKSHGPDLRLAAVAGPHELINAVVERRSLGPAWSSRILQGVLAVLLTDRAALATVEDARETYRDRRSRVVRLLGELGVQTTGRDGINPWVTTHDERAALVALAAQGIGAAPGSPFEVAPLGAEHVRLTVGLVRDRFDTVATAVADAALGRRGARSHQSR